MTTSLTVRQNGTFSINLRKPTTPVGPTSPIFGRSSLPMTYGENKNNMNSRWNVSAMKQDSRIHQNSSTNNNYRGIEKTRRSPPSPIVQTSVLTKKELPTAFRSDVQKPPVGLQNVGLQNVGLQKHMPTSTTRVQSPESLAQTDNPVNSKKLLTSSVLIENGVQNTPVEVGKQTLVNIRTQSPNPVIETEKSVNKSQILPTWYSQAPKSDKLSSTEVDMPTRPYTRPNAKTLKGSTAKNTPLVTSERPKKSFPNADIPAAPQTDKSGKPTAKFYRRKALLLTPVVKMDVPAAPSTPSSSPTECPIDVATISPGLKTESSSKSTTTNVSNAAAANVLITTPISKNNISIKTSKSSSPSEVAMTPTFRKTLSETSVVRGSETTPIMRSHSSSPRTSPPGSNNSIGTTAPHAFTTSVFKTRPQVSEESKTQTPPQGHFRSPVVALKKPAVHTTSLSPPTVDTNMQTTEVSSASTSPVEAATKPKKARTLFDRLQQDQEISNGNNKEGVKPAFLVSAVTDSSNKENTEFTSKSTTIHKKESNAKGNAGCALLTPQTQDNENVVKNKNNNNNSNNSNQQPSRLWKKNEPIQIDVNIKNSSRSPVIHQRSKCLDHANKNNNVSSLYGGGDRKGNETVDVVVNAPSFNRWNRNQPINFQVKLGQGITGGDSKESAAQRRLRENRGVRASNNPFKCQDAKVPAVATPAAAAPSGMDAATNNIDKLLKWIQKRVNSYPSVNVTNFTSSWEDGKALCALINFLLGDEIFDKDQVTDDKTQNLTRAIEVATANGAPQLMEPSEVGMDRRSMITYLHMIYTRLYVEKRQKEKAAQAGRSLSNGE